MGRGADEVGAAALSAHSRIRAMHLILCLDNQNGMAFNGRRQSRDAVQRAEMLATVGEKKLFLTSAAAALFGELPPNAELTDSAAKVPCGAYVFIEREKDLPPPAAVERLVIYRWGRAYPADEHAPVAAYIVGKCLISKRGFAGSSHPEMTEEVYA